MQKYKMWKHERGLYTMTCDQSKTSTSELAAGAGITAQERLAA